MQNPVHDKISLELFEGLQNAYDHHNIVLRADRTNIRTLSKSDSVVLRRRWHAECGGETVKG